MLIQHHREKALHAALYFISKTANCQKTKLLKLLYLLDFEHYRQIGRTVTGLQYQAWRDGPVAPVVDQEITYPSEEWQQHIKSTCNTGYQGGSPTWNLTAKSEFDSSFFSEREIDLLGDLATRYRSSTANELRRLCHEGDPWSFPWKKVWEEEGRRWQEIDPDLFLAGLSDPDEVRELAAEHSDVSRNYS